MKEKKLEDLRDKFPKIFGENFYFECGDGWYDLIYCLCQEIEHYQKYAKVKNDVKAFQVKEKFGGLQFYIDGGDATIDKMINLTERFSYHICERCGNSGEIRNDSYWVSTLCDKHHEENQRLKGNLSEEEDES